MSEPDSFAAAPPGPAELNGDITRQFPNHEEALALAHLRAPNSNLARCYLDLVTRVRAVSPVLANVIERAACAPAPLQLNARPEEWKDVVRVLRYEDKPAAHKGRHA